MIRDKIGDLKAAAKNAVQTMLRNQDPKNPRVRVALVPYASAVNAGKLAENVYVENQGGSDLPPVAGSTLLVAKTNSKLLPSFSDYVSIVGAATPRPDNCATERKDKSGNPDFSASGGYVFGSWVLTGESRPYAGGNAGNVKPKDAWGAWELLLRYSELDLEDGLVQGGKEHDWTLGANWYLNDHFKFQANLIRAWSDKGNLALDPKIFEVRAQIHF